MGFSHIVLVMTEKLLISWTEMVYLGIRQYYDVSFKGCWMPFMPRQSV
jgi:hypothetical protein